jgi:hypothetical protein
MVVSSRRISRTTLSGGGLAVGRGVGLRRVISGTGSVAGRRRGFAAMQQQRQQRPRNLLLCADLLIRRGHHKNKRLVRSCCRYELVLGGDV